MDYINIAPPFFESNRQFFEDIVTNWEHGKWIQQHLHGDFICSLTTKPHFAFFDEGTLSVYDGQPNERIISFWSVSRAFDPDIPLNEMDTDIEIYATYDAKNSWHFTGDVRRNFLETNAGPAMKRQLLNARIKSVNS